MNNTIKALALIAAALPLSANTEELDEILVTAEFRETRLMQSSASVSVIGEDTARERGAQHLQEILNLAPNVNFAAGTSRARYFQIRGIGDRSQLVEPLNPSVGLVLDDVDFSGIGSISTQFDIQQVEVLRGPQGTLHGANALAGLINIRSNAPTESFEHSLEATVGDYDTWSLGATSSGPITDTLRYRLAAQQFDSDGYTDNKFLDRDDTESRDELTLRGKLRWLAHDTHTVDLNLNYIDINNGYDGFSLDNSGDTLSDEPGKDDQKTWSASLQTDSNFSYFQLRSILSYADSDIEYGYDEDWVYVGFHPDGYSSTDNYKRSRDSTSAEVRLLSKESSSLFNGRGQWVAGLYYLSNREEMGRVQSFIEPFDSDYDTDTFAVFVQLDTALSQNLTLITGLRYEDRETDYSDSNDYSSKPDKQLWGGKIALEFEWSQDTMMYASITRGYRANGINAGILASIDATDDPDEITGLESIREFDEETLINYELGIKGNWLHNTLQARIAAFYMDRDDQQVRGSFLILQDSGATSFVDYTSNAAEGENYGAEVELDWLASDSLRFWLSLGLLETEFDDYVNTFGEDLSGREQAQAPNYQYATGFRLDMTAGFYLRLELEGKDNFYFSDRHNAKADSYNLLNASVGCEAAHWSLVLWGRNLGDEEYETRGFGSFGNDPRDGYEPSPYYQFGEPRMIGATARYNF